jgi:VanZ family protein
MKYVFPLALLRTSFWLASAVLTFLLLAPQRFLAPEIFNWWDKLQHSLAFGALTLLGLLAYSRSGSGALRVIILLSIYGALTEILQTLSGWRYGEFRDWLADLLGIAIAWGIFACLQKNRYLSRLLRIT